MFGPKRQTAQPTIKLPKLPAPPSFDDMNYVLAQSQKSRGRLIEVSWTASDRITTWTLTVKQDMDGGEPAWLMYRGEGPKQQMAFSYASGDLSLIYNLILSEASGGSHVHQEDQGSTMVSMKPVGQTGRDSGSYPVTSLPGGGAAAESGGFATVARSVKATLEGDLADMQVPNLLQSIAISKMTGLLVVQSTSGNTEIYFDDGSPVHAQSREVSGDFAMMELLTWEEGQFQFFPGEGTAERSIKKRLDAVLMEGVTLLDQHKYLVNAGLTLDSFLLRKNPNISEAQFEQMVSRGAPLDIWAQKQFYQAIDSKSTLFEILRKRPLGKTDWIPIMFNMMTCDLVALSSKDPGAHKPAPLEAMGIDQAGIQNVLKSISRPETNLFTYPAFLYFLEQEYYRFESYGYPFSLIIYELRAKLGGPNSQPDPLPLPAVKEMLKRFNSFKRNLDILGHFETFDYAIVLPNSNTAQATVMANRLADSLLKGNLSADIDPRAYVLAIGVASAPEDCQDLGMLLSAAKEAKNRAKQGGSSPVVFYKDLGRA